MSEKPDILCLFDLDGTLTLPRQTIDPELFSFLKDEVLPKSSVAIVGGSDYVKILEQIGGEKGTGIFEYIFSENGLVARQSGEIIGSESINEYLGEEVSKKIVNFCLKYMSEVDIPVKRGTFVEYRTGLINVCPVGRSCSKAERDQFFKLDCDLKIREKFVKALELEFADLPLVFAIGGQISIDIYPRGWDKTYCLNFLKDRENIHFFGDKTQPGGNDYEIFTDPRVIGHSVTGPDDTKFQLIKLLKL